MKHASSLQYKLTMNQFMEYIKYGTVIYSSVCKNEKTHARNVRI